MDGPCYKIPVFHSLLSQQPVCFLSGSITNFISFLFSLSLSLSLCLSVSLFLSFIHPLNLQHMACSQPWIQGLACTTPSARNALQPGTLAFGCCTASCQQHYCARVFHPIPPHHSLALCPALLFSLPLNHWWTYSSATELPSVFNIIFLFVLFCWTYLNPLS